MSDHDIRERTYTVVRDRASITVSRERWSDRGDAYAIIKNVKNQDGTESQAGMVLMDEQQARDAYEALGKVLSI